MKNFILMVILGFVIISSGCNKINREKFEQVISSGKAIDAGIAVGINYIGYGPLLQKYAADVSVLTTKKLNENEKTLFELLQKLLIIYTDANQVWNNKFDFSTSTSDYKCPTGMISIENDAELIVISEKYKLDVVTRKKTWKSYRTLNEYESASEYRMIYADDAIQRIWIEAKSAWSKINEILLENS
jgi:hypothetical protein